MGGRSDGLDVADLFDWLPAHDGEGALVTMLPDARDLDMDVMAYVPWLTDAVAACFAASTGPTVFTQTDRIADGVWLDKSHLVSAVAVAMDIRMLWHKIILRRGVGAVDIHRPTYTHMLAYGPGRPGRRTPDVIVGGRPERWGRNGVGANAAAFIADWFADVGVRRVLNPAAGTGVFVAECRARGIDAIGCDVVPRWDDVGPYR